MGRATPVALPSLCCELGCSFAQPLLARVLEEDGHARLALGVRLRVDLRNPRGEDVPVPKEHELRELGIVRARDEANLGPVEPDRDGIGIVRVVGLRPKLERGADVELVEHLDGIPVAEAGNVAVEELAAGLVRANGLGHGSSFPLRPPVRRRFFLSRPMLRGGEDTNSRGGRWLDSTPPHYAERAVNPLFPQLLLLRFLLS